MANGEVSVFLPLTMKIRISMLLYLYFRSTVTTTIHKEQVPSAIPIFLSFIRPVFTCFESRKGLFVLSTFSPYPVS